MYIAVHGGAGLHSSNPDDERELKHALRRSVLFASDFSPWSYNR